MVEEPALLAPALDRVMEGMDFADALHPGKAAHSTAFLSSIDRKLAKAAGRSAIAVQEP